MSESDRTSSFFRCRVQSEQSKASLRIGGTTVPAVLQETSIDGFTVTVDPKYGKRLRVARQWLLKTDNEKVEVHAEWLFHAPDGMIQLGLRRIRDLTPSEEPRGGLMWRFGRSRSIDSSTPELVFAGLVVFLFVTLTLPGLGDHLGTAPRIRAAVQGVMDTAGLMLRQVF